MNLAAIGIISCLLAQAPGEAERFEPHMRRKAPPAHLDEIPTEAAEATPARHESAADDSREAPSDEPEVAPRYRHDGESEPEERLAPVDSTPKQKLRPPELLAEALETLREGAVVGEPLSLQAALARTRDRQQQLKITQAYWNLCAAQVDHHWARNQLQMLGDFTGAQANLPGMKSARASARADVRDAQLAVAQAQQELSDLLGSRIEVSPPLTSDRPHVGEYNTQYNDIFSSRVPPPRIRLIHRTLSVRRKAIDGHAEAIVAALDALESTGEEFKERGQGLATVLATFELLKHERHAFMADVRAYNQEIAEYAFAVAPAEATGDTLVSMLIKTSRSPNAPPRNRSGSRAPARSDSGVLTAETADAEQAKMAAAHTAKFRAADVQDLGVYQGLLEVDAPERVQKLASLLHWDRNLPADGSEPATLAECLRGVAPAQRLSVVAAFWNAREQAARYQAFAEQVEQLNALPAIAIELRDRPGIAEASVRLQAARKSARAALLDAQVELLRAEFELTAAAGRRFDQPWLAPATVPQSGRYVVSTPGRGHRNSPGARFGDLVRLHHEKLEERADGVIQADIHRAELINFARTGEEQRHAEDAADAEEPTPLDVARRAITLQNRETLAFLHDLTGYNMAIVHFALATWPASISNDELVKKLVIARNTRRDT
jgi:hypothetical protein